MAKRKRLAGSLLALAFWLLIWFFLSRGKAGLFLAGPETVLRRLLELLGEAESWRRLLHSLGRVLCGFLAAFFLAPPLALLSHRFRLFRSLLALPLQLMKAVPLAALIILMIFWLPSSRLSPVIALMPAFPLLYETLGASLSQLDPDLKEMAEVYGLGRARRLVRIDLPQLLPGYRAAAGTALGFAFKAGIAAEVIGLPEASIGEALYDAKISLDSASLLAWVFLILGMSALVSRLFRWCFSLENRRSALSANKKIASENEAGTAESTLLFDEDGARLPEAASSELDTLKNALSPSCQAQLRAEDLGLRFNGPWLFRHLKLDLRTGDRYLLAAPSGSGKTSLLRVLGGREPPCEGWVQRKPGRPLAWLFQEDRLLERLSGMDNLRLVLPANNPDKEKAARLLLKLLGLESAAERPAATYSAGMKRRLAFARALLVDSPLLFLDEPLAHLDDENARRVRLLCDTLAGDRVLVMVSHREPGSAC